MMKGKSTCRSHRVIPFAELPKIMVDGVDRDATDHELAQFGIHVFDRGGHQVQAICCGFWDRETRSPIDPHGNAWPGTHLNGRTGIYRVERLKLIEATLLEYEDGKSGGRARLMTNKRPEEFDRGSGENLTVAITLTESERLERALPRIFGDG